MVSGDGIVVWGNVVDWSRGGRGCCCCGGGGGSSLYDAHKSTFGGGGGAGVSTQMPIAYKNGNGGGAGAHQSVSASNIAMSGGDGAVIVICYKEK